VDRAAAGSVIGPLGIIAAIICAADSRRFGMKHTFAVSIGGAAGQGVATPGNIFARIFGGVVYTCRPITHINPSSGAVIRF